jgi:hypothetical protein
MASRERRWGFCFFVVSALFATCAPTRAAWDGVQQIVPGDEVSAVFAGAPGTETHFFIFYAPDQASLTLSWKVAKGQALDVQVLDPHMQPLDVASHRKGKKIKRLPLPTRGRHTIQVRTTAGTGRYVLHTKPHYTAKFGGKKLATSSDAYELDLGLPTGTKLKAKVAKAKGSSGAPTFSGLDGPQGPVGLGKANSSSFKKVALNATGLFTLSVAAGGASAIKLKVEPKIPVGKTDYSFDSMQVSAGTQEAIRTAWLGSPHADLTAEPFAHWNNDSPAVVPQNCAKCHSGLGYQDFVGVLANPYAAPPESTPTSNLNDPPPSPGQGQVASGPWPVGTPVNCDACHNDATQNLTEVTFPSGLKAAGLGPEARCMVCHQGRESTVSVEKKISDAYAAATNPITSDDTVSKAVSFVNIHYFAAAGSLYGRDAKVAYEYADPTKADVIDPVTGLTGRMAYDGKFAHVASKDTCVECHDPHSLKVRVTECATCHVNRNGLPIVASAPTTDAEYEAAIDKLHDIRMAGTINDSNGNGDTNEGVYYELTGLRDVLYGAIRAYANTPKTDNTGAAVPATPIAYSPSGYPYFFVDPNNNGVVDPGETTSYTAWTARLLRAAYDYQYAQKDPGAFAHNAKYLIEILYDAIADINSVQPVAGFANLVRHDSGHFDTTAEVYRHWDEDTDHLVDPTCTRCHSPDGFVFRATYNIDQTIPAPLSSGMTCETCHETGANFSPLFNNEPARRYIASVTFPVPMTATSSQISAVTITNGAKGSAAEDDSYDCMTCHQGRESTLTVDTANPSPVSTFTLSFRNVHYLAAGATLYGNKAAVAYQYPGHVYAPPWNHGANYSGSYPQPADNRARCSFCHMQNGSHSFLPELTTSCVGQCHVGTLSLDTITPAFRPEDNWDGDPNTKPKQEVALIADRLYAAIKAYCAAAANSASPPSGASYCAYNGAAYPYWYKDTNKNGIVDAGETTAMKFDSKSLRAAFNYQFYVKEPGAWAHNNKYIVQILYDSIVDMGGDVSGISRP